MRPAFPRLCVFFAIILASAQACGRREPAAGAAQPKNIFGADDRTTPPDAAPYRAVGRFDVGCTGTLVATRFVLTAAHCIVDNAGKVKPDMTFFRPGKRAGQAGEALWAEHFWVGSDKPEDERLKDWAVVRLDKDPSADYGTLAIAPAVIAGNLPFRTNLVGYSTDRAQGDDPSLSSGCAVQEIVDGKLFHDCDGAAGVSGGPLLNGAGTSSTITGITVSEYRQGAPASVTRDAYSRDYANVAVPADQFAAAVAAVLAGAEATGTIEHDNPNPRPIDPSTPVDPGNPGNPVDPTKPGNPVDPGNPGNPVDPTKPGGPVIADAAHLKSVALLQAAGADLRRSTGDLIIASRALGIYAWSLPPYDLRLPAWTFDTKAHELENATALLVSGKLPGDASARLFAAYQAARSSLDVMLAAKVKDKTQKERLAALTGDSDRLLKQFENGAFGR